MEKCSDELVRVFDEKMGIEKENYTVVSIFK